jgi:hypothetical protein
MKRLILAGAAILLFAFGSWAAPVATGPSASANVHETHHARLLLVKRKHRRKRPRYKHHGRPRNHHRNT